MTVRFATLLAITLIGAGSAAAQRTPQQTSAPSQPAVTATQANNAMLGTRVEELARQIQALQAQVAALQAQNSALESQVRGKAALADMTAAVQRLNALEQASNRMANHTHDLPLGAASITSVFSDEDVIHPNHRGKILLMLNHGMSMPDTNGPKYP